MGLNGAFLTGDLFNLFVFFEVLLVASYCLLAARARRGAPARRLPLRRGQSRGVGAVPDRRSPLLYAVTGTLNLADLALRVPRVAPADAPLVHAAALVLLVVFAVKAAVFPLYLWLPRAYAAAAPPVAALFAIMTKVGVYAIVRVHGLVFGPDAGARGRRRPWLLAGAVATAGSARSAHSPRTSLARMTAYLTLASVGTLLIARRRVLDARA